MIDRLKGMVSLTALVPIAGATIGAIETNLVGIAKGIGSATESLVGIGLLGKAASLFK